MKTTHVLNGDALLQRFPKAAIDGDIVVARECLIEGDLRFESFEDFMSLRANWLASRYKDFTAIDYNTKVATQFYQIRSLTPNSNVCLWFEDDLFCQANMWFLTWIIVRYLKNPTVYWIRTDRVNPYSFGHMDQEALIKAYSGRQQLKTKEMKLLSQLWLSYTQNDHTNLTRISKQLESNFPSIRSAVDAHKQRFLFNNDKYGLPELTLLTIKNEFQTDDFKLIFEEFNNRASIYGFGDSQVREMLNQLDS